VPSKEVVTMSAERAVLDRPSGSFSVFGDEVRILTASPVQFLDITPAVNEAVARSGVSLGIASVQVRHTTAAILVNEDEPRLLQDLKACLERLAPRDAVYRHDDLALRGPSVPEDERRNGHAHCKALFLRASETIHVAEGRLSLGRWQRIFLVELDGPLERRVSIRVMGE
jgi:secondary thiamine-phosphate synthase enzyme